MATTSVCLDAHAATAASDRLVRAEPSGMRVGGRAAVSAFARGMVSGRAATASADGTVSRPPSLLARFLTPAVYNSLKDVRTPNGFGISDVTRSGRVNTDSSVGTVLQRINHSIILSLHSMAKFITLHSLARQASMPATPSRTTCLHRCLHR
jgi:hypothetical protein